MPHLTIGIPLPPSLKQQLSHLCCGLSNASWNPFEQLYLSLIQLHPPDGGAVKEVQFAMQHVDLQQFTPFLASFKKIEHFQDRLVLTLAPSPELKKLKQFLTQELHEQRIPIEQKPYFPHITLAHLLTGNETKVGQYLLEHETLFLPPFQIDSIGLFTQPFAEALQVFSFHKPT